MAALKAYRARLVAKGDIAGLRYVDRCIALVKLEKGKP